MRLTLHRELTDSLTVRCWASSARGAGGALDAASGPYAHETVEISWVDRGQLRYQVGRKQRLEAGPGDVVLIPAGVEHATRCIGQTEASALKISRDTVARISDAMGPDHGGRQLGAAALPRPERVVTLARLIDDEARAGRAGQTIAAEALLEALVVEALRAAPGSATLARKSDPRILAAIDLVQTCYSEPLTIADLARAASMSRYHFSRRFREVVGRSPYRYVLDTRLSQAAALLRGGRHSVTAAALSVGFSDLSRFSKMFRAWAGQSPEAYRRATRATAPMVARSAR